MWRDRISPPHYLLTKTIERSVKCHPFVNNLYRQNTLSFVKHYANAGLGLIIQVALQHLHNSGISYNVEQRLHR